MSKKNTGNNNSRDYNSGNRNSGHYNSGHYNSGNRNSGNYNSGGYNSGHCNSGHCNSGDYNSGGSNSGHCNSGHYNSGNRNSGNYNSGNRNSGFFNTDEPTVRLFNKDTGLKSGDILIPYVSLPVTRWISEKEMSDKQKIDDPEFHVKGGTLITLSYKEAWKEAWNDLSKETKKRFMDLPNFDADIFEEITGIRVDAEPTCDGKVVEIDGKKYKLQEIQR